MKGSPRTSSGSRAARTNRSSSRSGRRTARSISSRTGPAGGTCTASREGRVEPLCEKEAEFGAAAVGLRHVHLRLRRRRGASSAPTTSAAARTSPSSTRKQGSSEPVETPYSSIAYVRAADAGAKRQRACLPWRLADGASLASCGWTRLTGRHEVLRRVERPGDRLRLPLRPRARGVPDGERPDGARLLLPAEEPGLRGAGRRAPAAARDEPRRSDRLRHRRPLIWRSSTGQAAASPCST